jgi:4-hydroxy 2-oxovalerate aldolase
MKNVRLLDCTLRDGGIQIDFDFSSSEKQEILEGLILGSIDVIEIGYLNEKINNPNFEGTLFSTPINALNSFNVGVDYQTPIVAMIDYGTYQLESLESSLITGISGIRLAFYQEQLSDAILSSSILNQKGYKIYLQPMLTNQYSDMELDLMIKLINSLEFPIEALYIVDSFGEMYPNSIERIFRHYQNLKTSISIGFHGHNNLQLAFANSIKFLEKFINRDLLIDCSLLGMGKGAGNLPTELIATHINNSSNKYKTEKFYSLINNHINRMRSETYWGYNIEYVTSAIYGVSPSYALYFMKKNTIDSYDITKLTEIVENKKSKKFDKYYAEELYHNYNRSGLLDGQDISILQRDLTQNRIIIVSPSAGAESNSKIKKLQSESRTLVINLNHTNNISSYVLINKRPSIFINLNLKLTGNIITLSNINNSYQFYNKFVLDYSKMTIFENSLNDNSLVVLFNFLIESKFSNEIYLIGFDGFDTQSNGFLITHNKKKWRNKENLSKRNEYFEIINFFKTKFDIKIF